MKRDYEFFENFVDDVSADRLDSSAEGISFPGSWQGITNKRYESKLTPTDVIGRVLRFQLDTSVPIISRSDLISEGICKRPPILGLNVIKPGMIFSLKYLSNELRVFVTNFNNWIENLHNFADYVERQRDGAPHFALMFHERKPALGMPDERNIVEQVKSFASEAGYMFGHSLDLDKELDKLLVALWRQLMEQRFPHYK